MRPAISHDHGLGEAFGLVVNAADPDRVHMAPVGLGLRVDKGIAVDLAGGSHQEPGPPSSGQLQAVVGAQASGVQRLDGELQVISRRRQASQVEDRVDGARYVDGRTDVLAKEGHFRPVKDFGQVLHRAANEAIHTYDLIASVDEFLAKVGTKESGAPSHDRSHGRPIPV